MTAFLMDVLSIITRLSTILQGDYVDINIVETQIELSQAKLVRIKSEWDGAGGNI